MEIVGITLEVIADKFQIKEFEDYIYNVSPNTESSSVDYIEVSTGSSLFYTMCCQANAETSGWKYISDGLHKSKNLSANIKCIDDDIVYQMPNGIKVVIHDNKYMGTINTDRISVIIHRRNKKAEAIAVALKSLRDSKVITDDDVQKINSFIKTVIR